MDGSHNDELISVLEQCSPAERLLPEQRWHPECADLSLQPAAAGRDSSAIRSARWRRCGRRRSYIPGSHSLKIGYQGNISHPSQGYFNFTPFIQYRFNNGVPNQLNQTAVYPGTVKFQRNIL